MFRNWKTEPKDMSKLFIEFESDFMPNAFPDFTESAEKKSQYISMVERYCEILEPFDVSEVRQMFVSYIRSGGTFFPRPGDLAKQPIKLENAFGHVPSTKETAEYIRRQQEMVERAKELDTEENRERLAKIHEEIRRKLEANSRKDSDGTATKFGTFRIDFDSE